MERSSQKNKHPETSFEFVLNKKVFTSRNKDCVCACVCVRERERGGERGGERESTTLLFTNIKFTDHSAVTKHNGEKGI